MIRLFRTKDSELADQVEEALQNMVIAHETVAVANKNELPDDLGNHSLPVLIDNGEAVSGEENLKIRLRELQGVMKQWDKFKSDACLIDDDGTVC